MFPSEEEFRAWRFLEAAVVRRIEGRTLACWPLILHKEDVLFTWVIVATLLRENCLRERNQEGGVE